MHSRIYQISTEPIDEEEYFDESDFYEHWFLGAIADYVSEDTDRDEDITWLGRVNKEVFQITDGKLQVISKEGYFEKSYENFQELIEKMSDITLKDFQTAKCDSAMWKLKNTYDDEFSFYMYSEDYGLETLDHFMRRVEDGDIYYIGGTLDYHY